MFVCLFSIEIQTAAWIGMKFGTEVVLEGEGSWGVSAQYPTQDTGCVKGVQGASGASGVHFGKNFIKQKLQGTPDFVRAGHLFGPEIWIRKDLGHLSFWSHGHSL